MVHIVVQDTPLILASGSPIRASLLRRAGLDFAVEVARLDEAAVKEALIAEGAPARDIADALAEAKARRISAKRPDALVLGCDQILSLDGRIQSKAADKSEAQRQMEALSGQRHQLFSAAVIYEDGQPVWRSIGTATLEMRPLSPGYIAAYLEAHWDDIRHSVGCYRIEEEGLRLFRRVTGDYFAILGLPLLDILAYLELRGLVKA